MVSIPSYEEMSRDRSIGGNEAKERDKGRGDCCRLQLKTAHTIILGCSGFLYYPEWIMSRHVCHILSQGVVVSRSRLLPYKVLRSIVK